MNKEKYEFVWYFRFKIIPFVGKIMTGDEFNNLFSDITFVKLTNENECHNEFQYHDGLNVDIHNFTYNENCSKGGFYFTTKENIYHWVYYGGMNMYYMRKVSLPDDAIIYIEDIDKFKVDKFILGPREKILESEHDFYPFENEHHALNEYYKDVYANFGSDIFVRPIPERKTSIVYHISNVLKDYTKICSQ